MTPRTRAIVCVHLAGWPCEMDGILQIVNKHGIPVIEDCCLALGSKYKGRLAGTFGKAAYFSAGKLCSGATESFAIATSPM